MMETKKYRYGLATQREIAGMSGKELLQAIIDGHLPQAPSPRQCLSGLSRLAMASQLVKVSQAVTFSIPWEQFMAAGR
ncbi:MAG: hypothetical protein Q8M56_05775 [Desulfobacterales bacterium]|nr:hypothetical protein [Desulfobacterales bacterium]